LFQRNQQDAECEVRHTPVDQLAAANGPDGARVHHAISVLKMSYGFGIHFDSRLMRAISYAEAGMVRPEWQSWQTHTF
jgi:hypothetical protein